MIRYKNIITRATAFALILGWSGLSGATMYGTSDIHYASGSVIGTCTNVSTSIYDNDFYTYWDGTCQMSGPGAFFDTSYFGYSYFWGGSTKSVYVIDSSPSTGQYNLSGFHGWDTPSSYAFDQSSDLAYCDVSLGYCT